MYILERRIPKYTFCFWKGLYSEQAGRSTTVNMICWLYDFVDTIRKTEFYTLKGRIWWHLNYISIKNNKSYILDIKWLLKKNTYLFGWARSSVQFSRSFMSNSLWPHGRQHTRPPCPSPTPGVYSTEFVMPSNHLILCHPLFLLPSIFPASGSFPISQFLASGGQSIRVSASASVLPMNIQDWFPLGWIGWISLLSKGLSRVFFNTTVQKHQFFGTQLSL